MTKHKKKVSRGSSVGFIFLVLAGLVLLVAVLLRGVDVALFNPKGLIAGEQLKLMIFTVSMMLVVAIPMLTILYFFAWKYRDSNEKSTYNPHARYSKLFILGLWVIPSVVVLALATVMWPATHKLEPHQQIPSDARPLTIQVVALRWKWLFIYPEQNIATVNFVQVPVGTPVQFELTADNAPMSSFWIPHLGGQLYAMTGHVNRLNLMADTVGDYPGSSAEINGAGFSGMKFTARASSKDDFDRWAQNVQESSPAIDAAEYAKLLKPSEDNPAAFYTTAEPSIYDTVLMKYKGSHSHGTDNHQMEHR